MSVTTNEEKLNKTNFPYHQWEEDITIDSAVFKKGNKGNMNYFTKINLAIFIKRTNFLKDRNYQISYKKK